MCVAYRVAAFAIGVMTAALPVIAQDLTDLPRQPYTTDPFHSSIVFRVNHLGFSTFTASFDTMSATLDLDFNSPGNAALDVTIETASLDLPHGGDGFMDTMIGPDWLNAVEHPEITFRSTGIELTGDETADVTGDLTIAGVTRSVTLSVSFNGGWASVPYEPVSRLGFSATTAIKRSEFGMDFGLPPAGSDMGVADEILVDIETEFTGAPAQ